jgi:hypothetical protein
MLYIYFFTFSLCESYAIANNGIHYRRKYVFYAFGVGCASEVRVNVFVSTFVDCYKLLRYELGGTLKGVCPCINKRCVWKNTNLNPNLLIPV